MSAGKTDGYSIVGGVSRPIFTRCKAVLPFKSGEPSSQGIQEGGRVEDCQDAIENLDFTRGVDELYLQSLAEPGEGTSGVLRTISRKRAVEERDRPFRKKKRFGVDDEIVDAIMELLKDVIVTPPKKIMATMEWEDNAELHNLPEMDKDVQQAFKRWNLRTRRMSTLDFIMFYESNSKSRFLFQDVDNNDIYWDRKTSAQYCIEFIEHQFQENAWSFVNNLYNVLDSKLPKLNTIDVMSVPSCGKTWFFDMICDFYLNVGHMKNFNKYCQFPLQDCRDRRVLLWNEPNCHPEALDTLKTIFGGDRCAANIKCKDDDVINRTPLIVTGNSRIFPGNRAMDDRRFCYEFSAWPELKDKGAKKLFPLCWKDVLDHFAIHYI